MCIYASDESQSILFVNLSFLCILLNEMKNYIYNLKSKVNYLLKKLYEKCYLKYYDRYLFFDRTKPFNFVITN